MSARSRKSKCLTLSLFIGILFCLNDIALAQQQQRNPREPAYLYRAIVTRVIDADTIDVDIDLGFYTWIKNQRIRLYDIQAPERKKKTWKAWKAGKAFLIEKLERKEIIIRTVQHKGGTERKGKWGRWLGIIYLNGININNLIVEQRHAIACTFDREPKIGIPKC